MRSELTKVDGVSNLNTNVAGRAADFRVPNDFDIQTKLAEIATSNDHFVDWKMAN